MASKREMTVVTNQRWPESADFWHNKRVIVTGGAGFLGSFVVNKLWQRGASEVIVPCHNEYDLRQVVVIQQLLRETSKRNQPVDM